MEQDLELNEELETEEVVEETEVEQEQKFTICISDDGYYAEGLTENLVEVAEIPYVEDARHLKAYKHEDGVLVLDESKLEEIKAEISNEVQMPTDAERLNDLENAFLEFTSMMMAGGE